MEVKPERSQNKMSQHDNGTDLRRSPPKHLEIRPSIILNFLDDLQLSHTHPKYRIWPYLVKQDIPK